MWQAKLCEHRRALRSPSARAQASPFPARTCALASARHPDPLSPEQSPCPAQATVMLHPKHLGRARTEPGAAVVAALGSNYEANVLPIQS